MTFPCETFIGRCNKNTYKVCKNTNFILTLGTSPHSVSWVTNHINPNRLKMLNLESKLPISNNFFNLYD